MTVSTMLASCEVPLCSSRTFELRADFGKVAAVSVDVDNAGNVDILMTTSHESLVLRLGECIARARHPRGEYSVELPTISENSVILEFRFNIPEGFAKFPEMKIVDSVD